MSKPQRIFRADDAIRLVQALVLAMWPVATFAAAQSLGGALAGVELRDWIALLLLANVSGLVALLTRVRKSLEAAARIAAGQPGEQADLQLIPWRVFATIHMTGAMFAALLTFLTCEWIDCNSYLEALLIALLSYGGAKYVDRWADEVGDGFAARVAAAFGRAAR